ncbi:dihydrofolate reductase [Candidatus Saccharibacteria bacterium]|nr:dihydrofolate reductase [Candidatus Saccharibacteria bacterium]
MVLKMIAAVGENLELGKKDGLIWHLPGDLKFFKRTTGKDAMVMGDRTFHSLPGMLPGRKHIVLTQDRDEKFPEGVEVFYSLDDFMKEYSGREETVWVVGGGMIYKLFLPLVQELYLTEIEASDDTAEVYFPEFSRDDFAREVLGSGEDNGVGYSFVRYTRR